MDNSLIKALVIGFILAAGAVGLFLLLYFVILANSETVVRLMVSLVVPPVVLGLLVAGYYILTQDEKSDS